ncbi:DoxX family membrane protein [Saccharothrix isguenensis]
MRTSLRSIAIVIIDRYQRNQVPVQRSVIGVLYVWFGGMKVIPGLSPVDDLAGRAMSAMTMGLVKPSVSMPLLAVAEILIGIGLITGKLPRTTVVVALGHMAGIFLTVFVLPGEIWAAWGVPTLNGQYVLKNAVLVCALVNVALRAFRKAPEKAVVHGEAGLVDQLGQHVRR